MKGVRSCKALLFFDVCIIERKEKEVEIKQTQEEILISEGLRDKTRVLDV